MSAIQTSAPPVTAATTIPPGGAKHRFWFPLSVLALMVCLLAVPILLDELERATEHLPNIGMIVEMIGIPGAAALILLWWLFLSGYSWLTRLAGIVFLALLSGGFVYAVRDYNFVLFRSYYLYPVFRFKWEKTPDEIRVEHRAAQEKIDLSGIDLTVRPTDFARFRGRDADGVAHGPPLALDWSKSEPRVVYKQPCGGGYSGFAVAGNVAITMEYRADKEVVVCYDRTTGRERWTSEPLGRWKDVMGDGPRATPTIDDKGMVFALGASGILVCLDGKSGKEQWKLDILADSESKNVLWGMSGSPLLVDDVVVVNPGVNQASPAGRAVCAYERTTGKRRWAAGDHKAGYSSPRLVTLCGVRQILLFDGEGLAGLDPAQDGKELWRHPWATVYEMNNIQPLVYGADRVFISSELSNGCAMLRVTSGPAGWTVEELWKHKKFAAKFANPVVVGPAIYGLSGGDLISLDPETGAIFWKERGRSRFGHGQLLAAGDRILVQSDDGTLFLVAAEPLAYKELGRLKVLKGKTWNTPALAGTQLFLRDNEKEMACVELPLR